MENLKSRIEEIVKVSQEAGRLFNQFKKEVMPLWGDDKINDYMHETMWEFDIGGLMLLEDVNVEGLTDVVAEYTKQEKVHRKDKEIQHLKNIIEKLETEKEELKNKTGE